MNNEQIVIPKASDYNLNNESYGVLILSMEEGNLAEFSYSRVDGIPSIIRSARITSEGKLFLSRNSALSKLYKGLKEIKEFIPGL